MEDCVYFEILDQLKALEQCFFQEFIGFRVKIPETPFFWLNDQGLK